MDKIEKNKKKDKKKKTDIEKKDMIEKKTEIVKRDKSMREKRPTIPIGHLRLGDVILQLETFPQDYKIALDNPEAFRGYFKDIGFELLAEKDSITVEEFLQICKESVGKSFNSWKGDEFEMSLGSFVWITGMMGKLGGALVELRRSDEKKQILIVASDIFQ